MSDNKLGKGLSALLGDNNILNDIKRQEENMKKLKNNDSTGFSKNTSNLEQDKNTPNIKLLEISLVNPDTDQKQPRRTFDDESIKELSNSIKEKGVLQPIIVRKKGFLSDDYQIVSGERRWRASKLAGLKVIPAIIITAEDVEAWEIGIIENLQREDLNPLDEAAAIDHLLSKGYTKELLAKKLSKSVAYISNSVALVKLPKIIKKMLLDGKITQGHARPLLRLQGHDSIALAENIIKYELTVRDVEESVRNFLSNTNHSLTKGPSKEPFNDDDEDILDVKEKKAASTTTKTINTIKEELKKEFSHIERDLSQFLGKKSSINFSNRTKKPSGKLEIKFKNIDELKDILISIGLLNK